MQIRSACSVPDLYTPVFVFQTLPSISPGGLIRYIIDITSAPPVATLSTPPSRVTSISVCFTNQYLLEDATISVTSLPIQYSRPNHTVHYVYGGNYNYISTLGQRSRTERGSRGWRVGLSRYVPYVRRWSTVSLVYVARSRCRGVTNPSQPLRAI